MIIDSFIWLSDDWLKTLICVVTLLSKKPAQLHLIFLQINMSQLTFWCVVSRSILRAVLYFDESARASGNTQ